MHLQDNHTLCLSNGCDSQMATNEKLGAIQALVGQNFALLICPQQSLKEMHKIATFQNINEANRKSI